MKTLNELFNQPAKVDVYQDTISTYEAEFKINNNTYLITMDREAEMWDIEFELISTSKDGYGITGTGGEIQVFATVIDIIKKWVKKRKPQVIVFDAKQKSRVKLYTSLVKKLASGYSVEKELIGKNTTFTLDKK